MNGRDIFYIALAGVALYTAYRVFSALGSVGESLSDAGDYVADTASDAVDTVTDAAVGTVEYVTETVGEVGDWFSDLFDGDDIPHPDGVGP